MSINIRIPKEFLILQFIEPPYLEFASVVEGHSYIKQNINLSGLKASLILWEKGDQYNSLFKTNITAHIGFVHPLGLKIKPEQKLYLQFMVTQDMAFTLINASKHPFFCSFISGTKWIFCSQNPNTHSPNPTYPYKSKQTICNSYRQQRTRVKWMPNQGPACLDIHPKDDFHYYSVNRHHGYS